MCHLSQGAHTPYTRGTPWVKSPERVRLTGGRACWRERGHSYRSISSYRKLPPPACPGTTCILYANVLRNVSQTNFWGLSSTHLCVFCLLFNLNGWPRSSLKNLASVCSMTASTNCQMLFSMLDVHKHIFSLPKPCHLSTSFNIVCPFVRASASPCIMIV